MAETLLLAHTVGRAGWEVSHAGGDGEFALAAVGHCFVHRRLLFNLPLLWRLRRLWRENIATVDPRVLRLAIGADARVRVSGVRVDVTLTPPADAAGADARLTAALPLAVVREGDPALPALDAGLAWRVYALAPDGVRAFRRLARALAAMPKGTRVQLLANARDSRSPAALRREFPLRIDLLWKPEQGYLTLVPLRRIVLAG